MRYYSEKIIARHLFFKDWKSDDLRRSVARTFIYPNLGVL